MGRFFGRNDLEMTISPISDTATSAPAARIQTHPYMAPSVPKFEHMDGTLPLHQLADDELYSEIMECGVPLLEVLATMARGYRLGSPVALMAKAACVAACESPRAAVLTGIGGRPAPLNLMFCYVGVSGLGKGITLEAPLVCAGGLNGYRALTPASGEKLIDAFFDTVPSADGKGSEPVRHSDAVWASWGEVDVFVAKSGNANSTLDGIIRSLWSGEDAGDESITRKKSNLGCRVDGGSYRFVLSVGAQLDRGGVFLEDESGGTLQRLLWVSLTDDDAPETAAEVRQMKQHLRSLLQLPPGTRTQLLQAPTLSIWGPSGGVEIAEELEDFLIEDRGRVIRGEQHVDRLETHANNNRVRLGAIFAAWRAGYVNSNFNSTIVVEKQDWYWAGCVMELSARVRRQCAEATAAGKSRQNRDAGKSDAERFTARENELDRLHRRAADESKTKIMEAITTIKGCSVWSGQPRTDPSKAAAGSEIKRFLSKRLRVHYDTAIEELLDDGACVRILDGTIPRYESTHSEDAYTAS